MWPKGWREQIWSQIDQNWDLIVIGGGITGAGVARLATSCGLKTLLVEAKDFGFGTSSRSSKLVHGGFRYLYNRQFDVTFESVRQREELLREAPHLVTPLVFNLPNYEQYHIATNLLNAGVTIYDLMASKWQHDRLNCKEVQKIFNYLKMDGLLACFRYQDAELDDARLVLRVIREAVMEGATAINYVRVESLLRDATGKVCGAVLRDTSSPDGPTKEVLSRVVVNASGPWTDTIRADLHLPERLRKLRGSHLIFDRQRLPIPEALTIFHPSDGRAMFALPWESVSLVGTTDVDQTPELDLQTREPSASRPEMDYILTALDFLFPSLQLNQKDIISSFAGLRPIINSGASTPSKESRAHQIWNENGLITITGGKLTTFRIMARQTVQAVLAALGKAPKVNSRLRAINPLPVFETEKVDLKTLHYLAGRHGLETEELIEGALKSELEPIETLPNTWAELRYAARCEGVVHLDDLLLRRVRLGMLLPEGGSYLLPQIQKLIQAELGWNDRRWQAEKKAYLRIWQAYYSPNPGKSQPTQAH
jgi:glycerol-3-phosphate dehydrogenase